MAWTVISFAFCLNLSQLPGQIDAFSVEERGQSQQRQNYAALNEQLLSQLNYQLADSDKKVFHLHLCDAFTWNRMHICILTRLVLIAVVVEMILFNVVVLTNYNYLRLQLDEIGRRFTGVGGSLNCSQEKLRSWLKNWNSFCSNNYSRKKNQVKYDNSYKSACNFFDIDNEDCWCVRSLNIIH